MAKRARLLALALLTGCFGRTPEAAVSEPPPELRPRVAVLLYGFFNSEVSDRFAPERIDYVDVDLEQVHERLMPRIGQSGFRRAVRPLTYAETTELWSRSTVPSREASRRVRAALEVLDAVANEA